MQNITVSVEADPLHILSDASSRSTSSGTSPTSSTALLSTHDETLEEVPEPPNEYLCPVAHELMSDPVILVETGQTYDRSSIEKWFGLGQRRCPISGRELNRLDYIPNWSLKSLIAGWIKNIPTASVVSFFCNRGGNATSATTEPEVPEGWTFFPGWDSSGNDIGCSRFADSPGTLAKEAAVTNGCVAFNTNGFLKQTVISKHHWVRWTSDPRKGLYVQSTYLPRVDGDLPAIVPQPAANGWLFFPCWDSSGGDMQHSEWRDVNWLMQYASQQIDCLAFNTNGWLKKHLKPPSEWVKWTSDSTHGLYVRSSVLTRLGL